MKRCPHHQSGSSSGRQECVRLSVRSYQITMATIFRTASFKLWQKLTRALPLGPILPNMIPTVNTTNHTNQVIGEIEVASFVCTRIPAVRGFNNPTEPLRVK